MRRDIILITFLFALCLIVLALHPLYASEPPFAPIAVCKDGKCVMSEADYAKYRAWHSALLDRMQELENDNADLNRQVNGLQQKIIREAFCEAHRD